MQTQMKIGMGVGLGMNVLLAMKDAIAQGLLWGVMTLGAYISYKVLHFADLSVDGTFALGGAVSAVLVIAGVNPFLALFISMLAGLLGGLLTALLHTKLKIPGLLAGILTMLSLYSINMRIMGQSNAPLLNLNTAIATVAKWLPLTKTEISMVLGGAFCALLVVVIYWFFGTELGCAVRAAGDNEKMARAQGVSTDAMLIVGLMLSNGLVALSGGLVAQSQGYADVGMGTGAMVIGLGSIIIGEVVFRFMRRSFALKLVAAVLGAVVYRMIIAIVLQLGLDANDLKLLSAMVVAVALSVPLFVGKMKAAKLGREDNNATS